ncbi:MAG: hypothetical protein R2864_00875 [Syntrophotaleaceae bacterium]
MKNNLQVVSSLLFLQSQKVRKMPTCGTVSRSQSPASAPWPWLAGNSDQKPGRVSIKSYLNLVQQQQQIFALPRAGNRLPDAGGGSPRSEKVVPCGLLITEMLSNAYKHAFTDGRCGQVTISLQGEGEQIKLTVADNGVELACGFRSSPGENPRPATGVGAGQPARNGTMAVERSNGTQFRVSFAG